MTRERFTELVAREQEGLRRFLRALCGDAFEADDIAQDALVKAYVASDRYVERFRFSTWLFRIAYNCWLDRQRKRSPVRTALTHPDAAAVPDSVRADAGFEYQGLYAALSALSEQEKTSLLLFYMEDKPVREIAEIMDAREGTVKSWLSRGREHLKKHMGNER